MVKTTIKFYSKLIMPSILLASMIVGAAPTQVNAMSVKANIEMPFAGKWAWWTAASANAQEPHYDESNSSHPSAHHYPGSFGWSTDLYGNNKDVYPKVSTSSGTVKLKVASAPADNCSGPNKGKAGKRVRVNVFVVDAAGSETHVGWAQYGHLDMTGITLIAGQEITTSTKLGKTKKWDSAAAGSCWNVTSDNGVHVHFSASNVASSPQHYSCYTDHGRPGASTLSQGTKIGTLGSSNTGAKQACATTSSGNSAPKGTDTVGAYSPSGYYYQSNDDSTLVNGSSAVAHNSFNYGSGPWEPVMGDWNGNGYDSPGTYKQSTSVFYLRDSNSAGPGDGIQFGSGNSGWIPLSGDWDGVNGDSVGLYDPSTSTFHLSNTETVPGQTVPGTTDYTVEFGNSYSNWIPITGDWLNTGRDYLGLYDPVNAVFHLRTTDNTISSGGTVNTFQYGNIGQTPISGDWNGNGYDSIGSHMNGWFYLRNSNSSGDADYEIAFGNSNWKPAVGDWDSQ